MFAGVAVATPMKLWSGKCENNLTRAAHPLPPSSPTHRQQISQEGDSYSVAVKIATKSELVKTMIDEDEDDADEVQEVPLPNVKSSVLTKVIEFLKHDDAEPMSEIDKPLKSSNMSEVVQVRRE